MRLRFVTPERVLSDQEVLSVSLQTPNGEITILPQHAPLVSLVNPGIMRFSPKSGEVWEAAVSCGFVYVQRDGVIRVLTETAERGHELDMQVIEQAKERAQQVMRQTNFADDVSFAAAAAALERELARHKLAIKYKHRRPSAEN